MLYWSQNLQNPQNCFSGMESGQLARFPAATRLGAAPTYPFDVLHVLWVL
jgi:hypothetical protein